MNEMEQIPEGWDRVDDLEMTAWRMQPIASVLGVIAIVSVMITNTASGNSIL